MEADPAKEVVGVDNDGVYTISNPEEIAASWEKSVSAELTGFEIVKSKTEGDAVEDFYMLVARTEDGTSKVASLLEFKDNKFYFLSPKQESTGSHVLVICKGDCDEGCLPLVRVKSGNRYLICSSCAECLKGESTIY